MDVGRRRLAGVTFRPVWLVVAVAAGLSLLGLRLGETARYALLLSTLLVLGLPHGALDHLTVPRARGEAPTLAGVARFSVAYLAVAGVYTVAWFLAPAASFLGFILLTWFHWGQGDRAHLALFGDAAHLRASWPGRLTIAVRGGLPMLVPLLGFPAEYRSVALTVVGLFDPDGGAWLAPLFRVETRLALGVGFAALTLVTLALSARAAEGASPIVEATETLLLWAFFLSVPPLSAIGLYFAVWHSLRHLVRLTALDGPALSAVGEGRYGRALYRVVRDATPLTVGALVVFGLLAVAVPSTPASVTDVGGLYLVLLAVLTLPHVVVVTWLDRRQAVGGEVSSRSERVV